LKIPVIIIHGLWSNPLDLMPLANEIRGDPVIRERYQVCFYAYEAENPILQNAARFRKELGDWRKRVDPEDDDPASRNVVLIGHSMGGLLAKLMVKDVGVRLWRAHRGTTSFEEVDAAPDDKRRLENEYFPESLPDVKRVIFMATPHLGSERAGGFNGFIGKWLVPPTKENEALAARIKTRNPDIDLMDNMLRNGPRGLRPNSPLLVALNDAPWQEGVLYHSIIGLEDTTVRPGSSRQPGLFPAKLVHSDHGGVATDPVPMAEVRRILHEHLAQFIN
jgi:pimeloyl-ACP methyl ester carboxylesterase